MKLYYSPGACSLSPHIALAEAGLPFDLVKVDLKTHLLEDGSPFTAINPKGYVPVIEIAPGLVLTEGPAIVQYIADQVPASGLAPAAGTFERYRLQEWLGFINSEIHKAFSPLFHAAPEETKQAARDMLGKRFDLLAGELSTRPFLMGDVFTVADGYLFTVLNWCQWTGIDLTRWPALASFHARVAARPKVVEALRAEGLAR